MIIYLTRISPGARRTRVRRDATIPEDQPRTGSGCTDRLPSLCFVLHHMGFFVPRESLRER